MFHTRMLVNRHCSFMLAGYHNMPFDQMTVPPIDLSHSSSVTSAHSLLDA